MDAISLKFESNIIKIFLSSTFTDFRLERDYLLQFIIPEIKAHCKKKYGLDFQVIDRRWGVADSDTDNKIFTITDEVETCNNESCSPSFVAMIGNRYGYRILPVKIEKEKFKIIKEEMDKAPLLSKLDNEIEPTENLLIDFEVLVEDIQFKCSNLFETCYRLNENATPSYYWLLPNKQIFMNMIKSHQSIKEIDILENWNTKWSKIWSDVWKQIKKRLLKSFRHAANVCLEKGLISKGDRDRYYMSITEAEIINGIFERNDGSSAKDNCLVFIREINGVDEIKERVNDCLELIRKICSIKCGKIGNKKELIDDCLKLAEKVELSDELKKEIIEFINNAPDNESLKEKEKLIGSRKELVKQIKTYFKPCFCLFDADRAINDIEMLADNEEIIVEDGDTTHDDMINKLKNKIREEIGENTFTYEFECDKTSGLDINGNENGNQHSKLKIFGELFKEKLIELIDRNHKNKAYQVSKNNDSYSNDEEILNQWKIIVNHTKHFLGREEHLKCIDDYINQGPANIPLVIVGHPGSGKTSLIANYIDRIDKDRGTIFRFIGTTQSTTNITDTFKSIICELQLKYQTSSSVQMENLINMSKTNVKNLLINQLKSISRQYNNQITIILDGLEQLEKNDLDLNWIPKNYPNNVKFIFTFRIGERNSDMLEKIQSLCAVQILELEGFGLDTALEYINRLLFSSQRQLNDSQWNIIMQNMNNAVKNNALYPLYVKLLFDIASKWYSFDEDLIEEIRVENKTEWNSISDCIKHIFKKLEREYGSVLFQQCLIYINLSGTGISDVELEDTLSVDDVVLDSLFIYNEPPQRHFPSELWTRIKFHLREYFSVKTINNVTVFSWFHNEFYQVAQEYVEMLQSERFDCCLENMIDVFCDTWNNTAKPFERNDKIIEESIKKLNKKDAVKRYTSPQPYVFENGVENERKLRKTIEYISKIKYQPLLAKFMVERVLLNVDFLSVNGLKNLNNFGLFSKTVRPVSNDYDEPEVGRFFQNLESESRFTLLNTFISGVFQTNTYELSNYRESFLLQLCSYLLCFYGVSRELTKFIDSCDEKSNFPLVPAYKSQMLSVNKFVIGDYNNKRASCGTSFYAHGSHFNILCGENIYVFVIYLQDTTSFEFEQIDEIELPNHSEDEFSRINCYMLVTKMPTERRNLIKLDGGCLLSSKSIFCSIDFSGKCFLYQKYNLETIADCELLDVEYFLLRLENTNYFHIRRLDDSDLTNYFQQVFFECKIKCMAFKSAWKRFAEIPYIDSSRTYYIAACLENAEIHIYLRDEGSNEFFNTKILSFDRIVSECSFNTQLRYQNDDVILLTIHEDNSCRLIYHNKIHSIDTIDKKLTNSCSNKIKIFNFENYLAILYCNGKLYVIDAQIDKCINEHRFKKMFTINGDFIGVNCMFTDRNIIIIAYSRRTIDYYYINQFRCGDDIYKIAHLVHTYKPTDILRLTIQRTESLLMKTAVCFVITKMSQVYIEYLPMLLAFENSSFNEHFNRTQYKIENIIGFTNERICTYSYSDNAMDVWQLSTGKICSSVKSENKLIKDIITCKQVFFIISTDETNEESEYLFIDSYQYEDNCKIEKFFIGNNTNYVTTNIYNENKLIITYKFDSDIFMHTFSYINGGEIFEKKVHIKLSDIFKESYSFLSVFTVTHLNKYLVVLINDDLCCFIDTSKKSILFSISIKNLVNSNNFTNFELIPIENCDDVMIVVNEFGLFYLNKDQDSSTISFNAIIKYLDGFCCDEWVIGNEGICLLDQNKNVLYIVNLRLTCLIYQLIILEIPVKTQSPIYFSISYDLNYLAVCDIDALVLYRLEDNLQKFTKIAQIPFYDEITSIKISDGYVSISTRDRRIISYLIVDKKDKTKIKTLESRQSRELRNADINYFMMNNVFSIVSFNYQDIDFDAMETGNSSKGTNFAESVKENFEKLNKINQTTNDTTDTLRNRFTQYYSSTFSEVASFLDAIKCENLLPSDTTDISHYSDVVDALASLGMMKLGIKLGNSLNLSIKEINEHIKKKTKTNRFICLNISNCVKDEIFSTKPIQISKDTFDEIQEKIVSKKIATCAKDLKTPKCFDETTFLKSNTVIETLNRFKKINEHLKKKSDDLKYSNMVKQINETLKTETHNQPPYDLTRVLYKDFTEVLPNNFWTSLVSDDKDGLLEIKIIELQQSLEGKTLKTFEDVVTIESILDNFKNKINVPLELQTKVRSYITELVSTVRISFDEKHNIDLFLKKLMSLKLNDMSINLSIDDIAELFESEYLNEDIPELKNMKFLIAGANMFKYNSKYLFMPLMLTTYERSILKRKNLVKTKEFTDEATEGHSVECLYLNEWMKDEYNEKTVFNTDNDCVNYGAFIKLGNDEPRETLLEKIEKLKSGNALDISFINYLKIFSKLSIKGIQNFGFFNKITTYDEVFSYVSIVHYAAAFGRNDLIMWLYLRKVDIKCVDLAGNTALFYAMLNGQIETIILLKLLDLDYLYDSECNFFIKHISFFQNFENSGRFRINVLIEQLLNGIEYMKKALEIYENNCDELLRIKSIIESYIDF